MKNFGRLLLVLLLTVLGCGQSLVQFPQGTAPKVSFTDPADKAIGVATNTKVNAAFSEVMDATTLTATTFTLTQANKPVPATVTYVGTTASLTPAQTLAIGTRFTATITTAAKDTLGNALATNYVWSFTTGGLPDTTRPTVTITDPADKAVAVPTNAKVSAAFSKAMDATTLTPTTVTLMQGTTPITGAVTYSGLTATFTPASALGANTVFTAKITTGAKDLTGNALAADYLWSFTTSSGPVTTPPTVILTDPADKAIAVPTNTKVTAGFSTVMAATTITAASFTLMQGAVAVPGAVTYAGLTATFTPTSALAASTVFTATITSAAKDLAGNALAANYVWTFTTVATTSTSAPTVTMTDPADHAVAVATNTTVSAAFSEAMDSTTLTSATFTLMQGATAVAGAVTYAGLTTTFTPTSALAANTAFTATITTGAKSAAGIAMAANYAWGFTTSAAVDNTPPTVTITDPASDAVAVPTNTKVSAGFSKAMDSATLTPTTFTLMQGAVAVPGAVAYAGLMATFTPTSALAANTVFTATITTGAKDTGGIALAANYVWSFTTSALADLTPPTVTITDPASDAVAVPTNTKVSAGFSKAMDSATLTPTTFTLMQGAVGVPGAVTYAGLMATFTPTSALAANTVFTATITTGAKDTGGIALAANYVWSFTTSALADLTPPTVTVTDPVNLAIAAPTDTKVSASFSQVMDPATLDITTFTLMQGAAAVSGAVTYSGLMATFTPTSALTANTVYSATITTGAKDMAGIAMAANYVWSFTTGSLVAGTSPTITSTTPANNDANVAVNVAITATFSENMDAATITGTTFTVAQGGNPVAGNVSYSGTTATFTPTVNLLSAAPYTATVTTGVQDLAGNPMAVNYPWTFTTGTAPTVISTNPANAARGVAINRPVDATFSIAMTPATINPTTFTLSQVSGDGGVTPIAGAVTYAGTTATFTPTANYPANVVLTATITTGAQDTNGSAMLQNYVWSFETGTQVASGAVPLGAASSFAILGFNTVTNVNNVGTIVTGDIGIWPGTALVGFPPGVVIGNEDIDDSAAQAAEASLLAAYNDAVGRLNPAVLPGDVSGLTFTPGLYANSTSVELSAGNLTLDAQGDANGVFIFQMGSTLTTISGTQVILAGGAKATNIFWAVGTSATLGTTSIFKGTILAATAITAQTGAVIEGRLLAQGAAVTLDTNIITVPLP